MARQCLFYAAVCSTTIILLLLLSTQAARNTTNRLQYATIQLPVSGRTTPVSRRRYYTLRHPNYVTQLRSRQKLSGVRATIKTSERPTISVYSRLNRTLSKDGKYFMTIPASQTSLNQLRSMHNKHKLRSRSEHRRMWRDIYQARSDLVKLRTRCETMEKNASSIINQLERHKNEFHNYQMDSFNKLQQIENHQAKQDMNYFDVFEASANNSEKISQLQQLVDSLNDLYEGAGETAALDARWNQALLAQDSIQLEYENLSEEKSTPEEIVEMSYQRVMEDFRPQLGRNQLSIATIENSVARHSMKLESFSSSINDHQLKIKSSLALNQAMQTTIRGNNRTINELQWELQDAKNRITLIERQASNQANAYINLREAVEKFNSSLTRGDFADLRRSTALHPDTIVFREQVEGLSRALRHQSHRLANLSKSLRSANNEVHYLSMTTSNVYSILTKQAKAVHQQNETLTILAMKTMQHEARISDMETDLEYHHEMVMKLLNIVTNLAQQIRRPTPQHKDCHDLWMSGHTESGVYSLVHNMKTTHVYCNMTDEGGWTVMQRRNDGTQDFDRSMKEYQDGFGDVYGEYWLGLDTIKWLTHGRIYTLMIIIEDWGGNKRYAFYDRFLVFEHNYVLVVSGYTGDAGDSLTQNNQQSFKVRKQDRHMSVTSTRDCTSTRKAGWWFSPVCGDANPNGPYMNDPSQELMPDGGSSNMLGGLRWMTWRGEDYPLKKISMQIIPREAIDEDIFHFFPSGDNNKQESDYDVGGETPRETFDDGSLKM